MKNAFLSLSFILFSVILLAQNTQNPPQHPQTNDLINWISFEEAVKLQEEVPKTIIIDMYTDWCGWCKKMDVETFMHKQIADYINANFYAVKFDAETTDTIVYQGKTYVNNNTGRRSSHELAKLLMNGRMSYPTIVYIDFENNIHPVPGFMDVKKIEPLLIYFTERVNKNCDYADFLKAFTDTFSPDSSSNVDGNIEWMKFDVAVEKMKTEPKKMLLYINSDFSNASKIMLASTLKHPVISDYINENFYPVKINYDTQDTLRIAEAVFINEKMQVGYPNQITISLLQPDIRLPSVVFFGEDYSLIFALRGFFSSKLIERYMEFFAKDLHKNGGDWQKFNNEFESKLDVK